MGLDLWFREGIARILASVDLANQNGAASREMDDHAAAYRQGFCDCLQAVAVAFGIVVPVSEQGQATKRYPMRGPL